MLWTHSQTASNLIHVHTDIMTVDIRCASGRWKQAC